VARCAGTGLSVVVYAGFGCNAVACTGTGLKSIVGFDYGVVALKVEAACGCDKVTFGCAGGAVY
jgi:hypothetical protein